MPKKLTTKEAIKKTEKISGMLVGEYINSNTKTTFQCPQCNNLFQRLPSDVWFRKLILCFQCSPSGSRKLTQEQANFRDKKVGFTRLEKYKGCNKYHEYTCPYCNKVMLARPDRIWDGSQKSCRCRYVTGYELIQDREWKGIQRNAKRRKLLFNIEAKQAWEKFEEQNGKCSLSNEQLTFNKYDKGKKCYQSNASLDRIDSNLGYNIDNVWWIHTTLNKIKTNYNLYYFLELCNLVCNPLQHNKSSSEIIIKQHHYSFKGVGNLFKSYFCSIKHSAKNRNIVFDVKIDKLWDLFVKQQGYCSITGLLLTLKYKLSSASLDRINSSKNYTLNNIQWVHKDVNRMKWTLSQNELLQWCNKVITHYHPPEK